MVKTVLVTLMLACLPAIMPAQTIMREVKKDSVRAAVPVVRVQRDSSQMRTMMPVALDTLGARAALSPRRDTIRVRWNEDSLIAARTATADTVMRGKKSTTIAFISSMVLPGAGQIYNESYWKAPVVWGFGAYFYWAYRTQNDKYKTYRNQYAASVYADSTRQGDKELQRIRNFYYDDRNKFGWYMAITYLIQLVDAYVDASLFNFEVSPDLQPHGEFKATLHIRLR